MPRSARLDDEAHGLGRGLSGGWLDAQQGQLDAVVSTGNYVKFTLAEDAAEGPFVLKVCPLLELGGVAKLERAGNDADGVTGLAGGNVNGQMKGSGVEATAFDFALAGLDAVEHGGVFHLHVLGS